MICSFCEVIEYYILSKSRYMTAPRLVWVLQEQQLNFDLAKAFLHYLNHWRWETPSVHVGAQLKESTLYKVHFTRSVWLPLSFCHPAYTYDTAMEYRQRR